MINITGNGVIVDNIRIGNRQTLITIQLTQCQS
jgi:hypothetical protein